MTDIGPHAPEPAGLYDARGKTAAEIESDIDRTRAELDAVLGALEHRLAPRQLLGKGIDMMKLRMGGSVGAALREHPAPLALIGAGIGWLLVAETAGERIADAARSAGDRIAAATHAVAQQADEAADAAAENLYPSGEEMGNYAYARTKPSVGAAAAAVAERADQAVARARAGARRAADNNPLAFGLIGLLAGVAIGVMLPRMGIAERWRGLSQDAAPRSEPDAGI